MKNVWKKIALTLVLLTPGCFVVVEPRPHYPRHRYYHHRYDSWHSDYEYWCRRCREWHYGYGHCR